MSYPNTQDKPRAGRDRGEYFAQVPETILYAAEDASPERGGLSSGAKTLYGVLVRFWRDKPECSPLQETLAAKMGVSVRTVRRRIDELERAGLIEVEQQGLQRPNVYRRRDAPRRPHLRVVADPEAVAGMSAPERPNLSGQERPHLSAPTRARRSLPSRRKERTKDRNDVVVADHPDDHEVIEDNDIEIVDPDEDTFTKLLRPVGARTLKQRQLFRAAYNKSPRGFAHCVETALRGHTPVGLLTSLIRGDSHLTELGLTDHELATFATRIGNNETLTPEEDALLTNHYATRPRRSVTATDLILSTYWTTR